MKITGKLTSIFLSVILVSGAALPAASAQSVADKPVLDIVSGVQTVVTYAGGSQITYSGALNAEKSEENAAASGIKSYDIRYNEKTLLTVTPYNPRDNSVGAEQTEQNGYYSIEISGVDGSKTAFITGLSASNIKEVEDAAIETALKGKAFDLTSVDFIDSELKAIKNSDEYMSWAGAFSNAMTYTGWARQAGFNTCDELTDNIASSFDNKLNVPDGALSWFFNGMNFPENELSSIIASSKSGTGSFLNDYAFDRIINESELCDSTAKAKNLISELKKGNAVILTILNDGDDINGSNLPPKFIQCMSCWGYVVDNRYPETNPMHYRSLFVTDPYSDVTGRKSRDSAPNRLSTVKLTEAYRYYQFFPFDDDLDEPDPVYGTSYAWSLNSENNLLYAYTSIIPYSPNLEKETNAKATRNKNRDVDLAAVSARVMDGTNDEGLNETEVLSSGSDFYMSVDILNASAAEYSGTYQIKTSIFDESGNRVYSRIKAFSGHFYPYTGNPSDSEAQKLSALPAGKYTAEITLNPAQRISEAYYYNNTVKTEFTVKDPAPEAGSLKLKAENLKPGKDGISCDLRLEGLTDETRASITEATLYELRTYTYHDGETETEIDEKECKYDGLIPSGCTLENPADSTLIMRLGFKDKPAIYVYSDKIDLSFPSVEIIYDYYDDEESEYSFQVDENASSLKKGDSIDFVIYNNSDAPYKNNISLKYYLEAENMLGETIRLTTPVKITLKYGESRKITVKDFAVPLPYGYYDVSVVLEGDFVWSDTDFHPVSIISGKEQNNNFCDVNFDGKTDIKDATLIQKHLAMLEDFNINQLFAADCNKDFIVDITDVTTVQMKLSAFSA
ncbi:MAG TPA: hypothetical protein DEO32_05290 [Ruminococcaceae bacterium]|nr:hypothetical protein [Oscillospiraceae bacterium]